MKTLQQLLQEDPVRVAEAALGLAGKVQSGEIRLGYGDYADSTGPCCAVGHLAHMLKTKPNNGGLFYRLIQENDLSYYDNIINRSEHMSVVLRAFAEEILREYL